MARKQLLIALAAFTVVAAGLLLSGTFKSPTFLLSANETWADILAVSDLISTQLASTANSTFSPSSDIELSNATAATTPQQTPFDAFFIVAFVTFPYQFQRRAAQRRNTVHTPTRVLQTDHSRLLFVHRFFIGQAPQNSPESKDRLQQEMAEYGDIVQMPFEDGKRYSLTMKRFELLKWAAESELAGNRYSFLIQIDDDCYAELDRLAELLLLWKGEITENKNSDEIDFVPTNTTLAGKQYVIWGNIQTVEGPRGHMLRYPTGFFNLLSAPLVELVYSHRDEVCDADSFFRSKVHFDDVASSYWAHRAYHLENATQPLIFLDNFKRIGGNSCYFFLRQCGRNPKDLKFLDAAGSLRNISCTYMSQCVVAINHVGERFSDGIYALLHSNAISSSTRKNIRI